MVTLIDPVNGVVVDVSSEKAERLSVSGWKRPESAAPEKPVRGRPKKSE